MAGNGTADVVHMHGWKRAEFDDFASMCCGQHHLKLKEDSEEFSLTQRMGRMGPVTVSDIVVGSNVSMDGGEVCGSYRVLVVQSGSTESRHRGVTIVGGPGSASVYAPEGLASGLWTAGTRLTCCKIRRSAVDAALSDALGRNVRARSDFTPIIPMTAAPTRSWLNMLMLFKEQMFRPNSLLNQPLVGMPFVDSLVRGFLLATEHPHRDALAGQGELDAPRVIRAAVDIIEEEAHLPLTVSSLAARCHISARSLQQGFRRYLGTTPMAYLREVRLRRAHEALLASDPSIDSVASIAYRWGFSNLGRFASAHAMRYHEPPSATLRRSEIRRNGYRWSTAAAG